MSETATANFVTTIPLRTTPRDRAILRKRFVAGRAAYNALLGECLRRSRLMRESKAWSAAGKMSKGKDKTKAYRDLVKLYGFREYDLYPFIQEQRKSWIGHHLDSHTMQALACRAFNAVQKAIYKKATPHFRRAGEFQSVQGVSAKSPLRWVSGNVLWSGLSLAAVIDPKDPVIMHGIESKVGVCRIVHQVIRGEDRYFAQLVCTGDAYVKTRHTPPTGIVGLDIGPSTIAVVGESSASLERFADEVVDTEAEVGRLQRRADRQIRAGNPECFDEKKRWLKGKRAQNISKRLRKTRLHVADLRRRQQAHRKNLHGRLAHRVLSLGNDVRTEKLSYKAFQRMFGKSVGVRAPGMFVANLKRVAAKYGATVTEFETRTTRLSQTCVCGAVKKKLLSERTHRCDCGVTAQRDLFSAHLARHVTEDRLDVDHAREGWSGACNLLEAASKVYQRGNGSASAGTTRKGRAASLRNVQRNPVSAVDAVPALEAERAAEKPEELDSARSRDSRPRGGELLGQLDLQLVGLNL